jgi:hypothetical protein
MMEVLDKNGTSEVPHLIDGILVLDKTVEEFLKTLREVFLRLHVKNLKVNPKRTDI